MSEALVDLLSRMTKEEVLVAIDQLFILGHTHKQRWAAYIRSNPGIKFIWETQRSIEYHGIHGRIDIVLMNERREVLLIVENKIDASFQQHFIDNPKSSSKIEEEYQNQLATYGRWLSSQQTADGWSGGLVLLTHAARIPDGFGSGSIVYGVDHQSTQKWSEVCSWLTRQKPSCPAASPDKLWFDLAAELSELLEEWGMNTEIITNFDLSVAEIFTQSFDRIDETFIRIYDSIKAAFDGLSEYAPGTWDFDVQSALMGQYTYIGDPLGQKRGWYLAWGFRFPAKSRWWTDMDPPLPSSNHVYLCVVVERKGFPGFRSLSSLVPAEWAESSVGDEIVVGKSCAEFVGEPEQMVVEMGSWIAEKIKEIKPALVDIRTKTW